MNLNCMDNDISTESKYSSWMKALPKALLVGLVCANHWAFAQSDIALATKAEKLEALKEKLEARGLDEKRQAQRWAKEKGIPFRRQLPEDKVLELQRISPKSGPVFYITNNVDAADTVSTDDVWPGGSAGLLLDGRGLTIGEWDGGAVLTDHPDLYPRATQIDGASIISNHSTHVAGTLIGAGTAQRPEARGMAYAANLSAYDWNSDTAEMAAAAAGGMLVSNHSYGLAAGWLYIGGGGPDEWWWIGGAGNEDPNFGYYDTVSQTWDQIAYDAPYYLIVKAAGNDRWDTGPASGETYTVVNQDGVFQEFSSAPRPGDCTPAGYDCLPTNSVAKNILTIGAVDDISGGYQFLSGPSSVQMTAFSGWGPTDDGRIKPDLVGNGWLLVSIYGENPYYAPAIGTSMASPNVAGSLLLLQQHHENLHGNDNFMRSATLKALAIHTADEAGGADGPDYEHGWGLLNTRRAAELISDDFAGGVTHQIVEGTLDNGETDTINITITDPDAVVTATLVWMDPPGTPPPFTLDPNDPMLVNDLDLRINNGGPDFFPWILDPIQPADPAGKGDNFRDNVEQVQVVSQGAGNYTINVSHKGGLQGDVSQDYSLITTRGPPPPTSSGFLIDENFTGVTPGTLPDGWSIDTPYGVAWSVKAPIGAEPRYQNNSSAQGNAKGNFAMVDSQFAYTSSRLNTPVLDLSTNTGAVLTFNSYFKMTDLETINVDVSSDGGASWTNSVWQKYGFTNPPNTWSADLSSYIAGEANVRLRFRFESSILMTDADYWQIDDIKLETFGGSPAPTPPPLGTPGQAEGPGPATGSTGVALDVIMTWSGAQLADTHDIYFGTTPELSVSDFQGNYASNVFSPTALPEPLQYNTQYFWRVNGVNSEGTTEGITWSFTTETDRIALAHGTPDTQQYGHGYGSDEHETEVRLSFDSAPTDLVLTVIGFDIDTSDEVSVFLNDVLIGHLQPGPNMGLIGGNQFLIDEESQNIEGNEIKLVQKDTGETWGVTQLLVESIPSQRKRKLYLYTNVLL